MPLSEVIDAYAATPAAFAFVFVLGALWGSFANVCIYRWPPTEEHPKGRSVVSPGSHCGVCGVPVRWYDNLPIVSYLVLRGRCRSCRTQFSARYMLVEAATGLLFAFAWHLVMNLAYVDEPTQARLIRFGIYAAMLFVLVVITFIDLDHQLILDKVTYPSIVLFYGAGMLLPDAVWWHGLLGAAVGYGGIRLIADGYYYLTGREGMGYGDGKLLALIGALFGWRAVVLSLFIGSMLGSVIGIAVLVIAGRMARTDDAERGATDEDEGEPSLRHTALPFGPFLAAGAVVYMFALPWLRVSFRVLWGGD